MSYSDVLRVQDDPVFLAKLVDDMRQAPNLKVEFEISGLLSLVSMLQVAMRHPELHPDYERTAGLARQFVLDVQHHYRAYETLHRLIELGFTADAPGPC